ncbi:hypothetical protein [Ectobacillus funiculus]|uniref:hypothetical protein n=1 Tax=Ectobacillus funiculus TaxID=137993 RepID=UPI00196AD7AA|nr:hypothetical protein [Ectobacillus funiculus]
MNHIIKTLSYRVKGFLLYDYMMDPLVYLADGYHLVYNVNTYVRFTFIPIHILSSVEGGYALPMMFYNV